MNSDKFVYYNFCLLVAIICYAMAGIIYFVDISYAGDGSGFTLAKKILLAAAAFSIPPLLWKISKRKEKNNNSTRDTIITIWIGLVLILTGMGAGLLQCGKIRIAMWCYVIGSLILAFPLLYVAKILIKALGSILKGNID